MPVKRIITTTLLCSAAISLYAQNEEDFARLARRSMKAYETTLRNTTPYDSIAWHGGVYVGNSSQGRILPNAYFTFRRGKWDLKGDFTFDASHVRTYSDEESTADAGAFKATSAEAKNNYEHQDFTFHADHHTTEHDVFSFDVFQKYYHDRVNESSMQSGYDAEEVPIDMRYEEQERAVRDFNFGVLVEHTHKFKPGGSLATRVYLKYDNKPTDVNSNKWGENMAATLGHERQEYTSADPKAQVVYLSPNWSGFSFGVREKLGMMNMRIDDTTSNFGYNVRESLSSFGADYKRQAVALSIGAGYELYHHDIKDHVTADISHTYRNWLYNASAAYTINKRNKLTANYRHSIVRPTYTQLYPFVHIGSSIASWVVGNSQLEPSTVDQWQAKYTFNVKPLTLNAIVTYKVTDDDITRISTYNEDADRWVKTWVNDASYHTLRMALEGEVRAGCFSMTMGVHAQWLQYSGENVTADNAWSYSFKVRPQVVLPGDWTLACVALYNGREVHLHEYNQGYTYTAFRVCKQVGAWGIYGFVQDILRADHVKVLRSAETTIVTTKDLNARALILGCSYTF